MLLRFLRLRGAIFQPLRRTRFSRSQPTMAERSGRNAPNDSQFSRRALLCRRYVGQVILANQSERHFYDKPVTRRSCSEKKHSISVILSFECDGQHFRIPSRSFERSQDIPRRSAP